MLLSRPLTATQLSPAAQRSWAPLSGHTLGNRHDRRAKPGEGLRCCVWLHTRYLCSLSPSPLLSALSPLLLPPLLLAPPALLRVHLYLPSYLPNPSPLTFASFP
ncbi:unnamed protein product [Schistocephalus solidus]|uniref:Secreted protein n=1 Tax=Schistocephalus solidus TaxID=70667 RepID=A0A183SD96_SCHSO|nr:unnamed protein product [Schistocephalus solidus]